MLTLTIPVAEQAKLRRIDIQGGSEPQPVSTSTGEKENKEKAKS